MSNVSRSTSKSKMNVNVIDTTPVLGKRLISVRGSDGEYNLSLLKDIINYKTGDQAVFECAQEPNTICEFLGIDVENNEILPLGDISDIRSVVLNGKKYYRFTFRDSFIIYDRANDNSIYIKDAKEFKVGGLQNGTIVVAKSGYKISKDGNNLDFEAVPDESTNLSESGSIQSNKPAEKLPKDNSDRKDKNDNKAEEEAGNVPEDPNKSILSEPNNVISCRYTLTTPFLSSNKYPIGYSSDDDSPEQFDLPAEVNTDINQILGNVAPYHEISEVLSEGDDKMFIDKCIKKHDHLDDPLITNRIADIVRKADRDGSQDVDLKIKMLELLYTLNKKYQKSTNATQENKEELKNRFESYKFLIGRLFYKQTNLGNLTNYLHRDLLKLDTYTGQNKTLTNHDKDLLLDISNTLVRNLTCINGAIDMHDPQKYTFISEYKELRDCLTSFYDLYESLVLTPLEPGGYRVNLQRIENLISLTLNKVHKSIEDFEKQAIRASYKKKIDASLSYTPPDEQFLEDEDYLECLNKLHPTDRNTFKEALQEIRNDYNNQAIHMVSRNHQLSDLAGNQKPPTPPKHNADASKFDPHSATSKVLSAGNQKPSTFLKHNADASKLYPNSAASKVLSDSLSDTVKQLQSDKSIISPSLNGGNKRRNTSVSRFLTDNGKKHNSPLSNLFSGGNKQSNSLSNQLMAFRKKSLSNMER